MYAHSVYCAHILKTLSAIGRGFEGANLSGFMLRLNEKN